MSNDIAGGRTVLGSTAPVQLFAGEAPIVTNDYELTTNVAKYQVCRLDAAGKQVAVDAVDAVGFVIASQAGVIGDRIAFFEGGFFNHEALNGWPAGSTTFEQRRALVGPNGSLKIGRLVN
jgi:hypothetical protein